MSIVDFAVYQYFYNCGWNYIITDCCEETKAGSEYQSEQ